MDVVAQQNIGLQGFIKPHGGKDDTVSDKGAASNANSISFKDKDSVRLPSFQDVNYSNFNNETVTVEEYETDQMLNNLSNVLRQQLESIARSFCGRNGVAYNSADFEQIFNFCLHEADVMYIQATYTILRVAVLTAFTHLMNDRLLKHAQIN